MSENDTFTLKAPEVLPSLFKLRKDELDIISNPGDALAVMTGVVVSEKKEAWLALSRVAQAALKGEIANQFLIELQRLKDKGKLADGFEKDQKRLSTWTEIMSAIDSGETDEERLTAMKSMFYAMNKVGMNDQEKILGYQLFQIAKKLSSGELLLLRTIYDQRDRLTHLHASGWDGFDIPVKVWVEAVAKALGHGLEAIVELYEKALVENSLITPRNQNGAAVVKHNGRLSDLGFQFVRNIQTYEVEAVEKAE